MANTPSPQQIGRAEVIRRLIAAAATLFADDGPTECRCARSPPRQGDYGLSTNMSARRTTFSDSCSAPSRKERLVGLPKPVISMLRSTVRRGRPAAIAVRANACLGVLQDATLKGSSADRPLGHASRPHRSRADARSKRACGSRPRCDGLGWQLSVHSSPRRRTRRRIEEDPARQRKAYCDRSVHGRDGGPFRRRHRRCPRPMPRGLASACIPLGGTKAFADGAAVPFRQVGRCGNGGGEYGVFCGRIRCSARSEGLGPPVLYDGGRARADRRPPRRIRALFHSLLAIPCTLLISYGILVV